MVLRGLWSSKRSNKISNGNSINVAVYSPNAGGSWDKVMASTDGLNWISTPVVKLRGMMGIKTIGDGQFVFKDRRPMVQDSSCNILTKTFRYFKAICFKRWPF